MTPERHTSLYTRYERRDFQNGRDLVDEIRRSVLEHQYAEEEVVHPFIRTKLLPRHDVGETCRKVLMQWVGQHDKVKDIMKRIGKMSETDAKFDEEVRSMIAYMRHESKWEESNPFPVMQDSVSATDLDMLGEKLNKTYPAVPARSHPYLPPITSIQKPMHRVLKVLDDLRDRVTGHTGPGGERQKLVESQRRYPEVPKHSD
ncbi:uncharacterized protein EV422DRAFT_506053 [Fimicolochytrium jonesii]|uniref:uncharacterized protein n=1 Tax=Fimicolochytrium jonesii TaxID=1396493 RepID=UPI0022FF3E7E|nr:uncharacterized protein EV422DRAFT_506053 [Fimicolochytrium jonesii]KAI8821358.1 hypothetical protein EV422DRAFT_506053 [Fimicolochytrium jonesii]